MSKNTLKIILTGAEKLSSEGWIMLHRQIEDNPLYFAEPFTRCGAWIDLLLLANHKDNIFYNRSIKVEVKRGQIGWALENLAKRWKWSRGKAERFICELEKANQIVRQKNNITTLITIVKYDYYQSSSKANGNASSKADSKADGHQVVKQTDTNKNEDKDNNENNDKNLKNKDADLKVLARLEKNKLKLAELYKHEYFQNEEFTELWETFNINKGNKATIDAKIMGLNKLFKFTIEESIEALENSIISKWPGLFPKKANAQVMNGKPNKEQFKNTHDKVKEAMYLSTLQVVGEAPRKSIAEEREEYIQRKIREETAEPLRLSNKTT